MKPYVNYFDAVAARKLIDAEVLAQLKANQTGRVKEYNPKKALPLNKLVATNFEKKKNQ